MASSSGDSHASGREVSATSERVPKPRSSRARVAGVSVIVSLRRVEFGQRALPLGGLARVTLAGLGAIPGRVELDQCPRAGMRIARGRPLHVGGVPGLEQVLLGDGELAQARV